MKAERVAIRCSTCRRLLREAHRDYHGGWSMPVGRLADGRSVQRSVAARVLDGTDTTGLTPAEAALRDTVVTLDATLMSLQTSHGAAGRVIFECAGKRHTLRRPVRVDTLWQLVDAAARRQPAEVLL